MPNLATTNRRAPWIGIGVQGQWSSSTEALEASQLDFDVRQEELFWQRDEGGIVFNEPAPMFANVRNTDDKLLGCVTQQYQVIQNRDAFALLDPFLNNGYITAAGMTGDGLAFMVAEIVTRSIANEDYVIYLMATNSFNTKYPCQIIMTPLRIVCQNMYRKLTSDRILLAKHTTTVHDRIQRIAQGNAIEKKVDTFTTIVENAQQKQLTQHQLWHLIEALFPYPKEGGPREVAYKAKADEAREQFMDVYYDAPDNVVHHGSAFGFINAYYDYLSHRNAVRETGTAWADRRFSGLVSGNDVEHGLIREALR